MIRSDPPTASSTAGIRLPDSATAITASRKASTSVVGSSWPRRLASTSVRNGAAGAARPYPARLRPSGRLTLVAAIMNSPEAPIGLGHRIMSCQDAAQRAQSIEGARSHSAGRDLQYARRFGHRPVAVIDFGQHPALQTGQGGDCGADSNLVDA